MTSGTTGTQSRLVVIYKRGMRVEAAETGTSEAMVEVSKAG